MHIKNLKIFTIAMIAIPALLLFVVNTMPSRVAASSKSDPAAKYAASCKMCHGAKAEKHFDAEKTDSDLARIILDGKAAKPIAMPAYKDKTPPITEEEALALAAYMKTLKAAAD